ncbi:FAD-dependent oxidoreductase [Flindersiella endophytica]
MSRGLSGRLVRPGDSGYADAHELYSPRFDDVRPAVVVQCGNAGDVAEALRFVSRFGLRATARSGGHSYVGASVLRHGVVLDLRDLDGVELDGDSAWIGAGARLSDVYDQLGTSGRAVPAGTCPTVGLAGLALGGGIGLASRAHGLTCDTIAELEVVTLDGRRRTIDEGREPDLFWACRGGGGGTAAVVTRFRLDTYKQSSVGIFRAEWSWSRAAKVAAAWQRWLTSHGDRVWANLHLNSDPDSGRTAVVYGADFDNDPDTVLRRLVNAVGTPPSGGSFSHAGRVLGPDGGTQRVTFWAGSDILGRALPAEGIDALVSSIDAARSAGLDVAAIVDPYGGAVGRVPLRKSAFPWRRAFGSIQWYAERGRAGGDAAQSWIAGAHRRMSRWSTGAYVNYLEASRPDGSTYFGSSTQRLREVRSRYDPDKRLVLPYTL